MSVEIVPYPHIRDLRECANLSQADVAKLLNCSQVSYSYYEIGRRDIPIDHLIKLAKFYNTSVDYLLGLTNISKPYPEKH